MVEADCVNGGSYDEVVKCSRCNEEISRTPKTVNALGHDWGEWVPGAAASCDQDGTQERTCSRCGFTESEVTTPSTGHQYVDGFCEFCGKQDPDYEDPDIDNRVNAAGFAKAVILENKNFYMYAFCEDYEEDVYGLTDGSVLVKYITSDEMHSVITTKYMGVRLKDTLYNIYLGDENSEESTVEWSFQASYLHDDYVDCDWYIDYVGIMTGLRHLNFTNFEYDTTTHSYFGDVTIAGEELTVEISFYKNEIKDVYFRKDETVLLTLNFDHDTIVINDWYGLDDYILGQMEQDEMMALLEDTYEQMFTASHFHSQYDIYDVENNEKKSSPSSSSKAEAWWNWQNLDGVVEYMDIYHGTYRYDFESKVTSQKYGPNWLSADANYGLGSNCSGQSVAVSQLFYTRVVENIHTVWAYECDGYKAHFNAASDDLLYYVDVEFYYADEEYHIDSITIEVWLENNPTSADVVSIYDFELGDGKDKTNEMIEQDTMINLLQSTYDQLDAAGHMISYYMEFPMTNNTPASEPSNAELCESWKNWQGWDGILQYSDAKYGTYRYDLSDKLTSKRNGPTWDSADRNYGLGSNNSGQGYAVPMLYFKSMLEYKHTVWAFTSNKGVAEFNAASDELYYYAEIEFDYVNGNYVINGIYIRVVEKNNTSSCSDVYLFILELGDGTDKVDEMISQDQMMTLLESTLNGLKTKSHFNSSYASYAITDNVVSSTPIADTTRKCESWMNWDDSSNNILKYYDPKYSATFRYNKDAGTTEKQSGSSWVSAGSSELYGIGSNNSGQAHAASLGLLNSMMGYKSRVWGFESANGFAAFKTASDDSSKIYYYVYVAFEVVNDKYVITDIYLRVVSDNVAEAIDVEVYDIQLG